MGTIVAALMALMVTVVSFRVLRDHSTLNNPVIPVCVGLLSFIGLQHLPEGVEHTVLIGYIALPIAILFLLLLMAFYKARHSSFLNDLSKVVGKQIRHKSEPGADLASPSTNTEYRLRHRRHSRDENSSMQ
jgi:hypothetical protein